MFKGEKFMKMYRHGDLLIRQIDKIEKKGKKEKELTIAYGEATGHHHTLYGSPQAIIEGFDDKKYFRILGESVELRHQEHKTLKIEPGDYEITYEREYDYFEDEFKKVVD